jgi:hypothetical protein
MDKVFIGNLIILLFVSLRYFIFPICAGIISFINIFTIKNKLKKAGINYCKKPDLKIKHLWSLILTLTIIIVGIIVLIISGHWFVSSIGFGFILLFLSQILSHKLYSDISGIYENGIIDSDKKLMEGNTFI